MSSNQAEGGSADWQITGDLTLNLRAEATGGQARVYTIQVRVTDASGNASEDAVTVTVQGQQSGVCSKFHSVVKKIKAFIAKVVQHQKAQAAKAKAKHQGNKHGNSGKKGK